MKSSPNAELHVRRDDEERVHRLHLAQVALRDRRDSGRDLLQRAHQVLGRAGDQRGAAVGRVLAVARDRPDQDVGHGVRHDRDDEHDEPDRRPVAVAAAAAEEERVAREQPGEHREEACDGHDQHVAVRDVRELVREHALDLARLEPLPEAARHGDGRVLRVAAGRERVRDVGVDHGDPRLRQVGHRAEPLDHRVELRRLLLRDDLRAGGPEGELVRREVLEEGEAGDDQHHREDPDVEVRDEDRAEDDVEQAEQPGRREHPEGQPRITSVRPSFHRQSAPW